MVIKRRYLPSLGSFATFEVAAKHLSFTVAANELNVTQAAISQQIRGLEKALGMTLFVRRRNALELSQEGYRLFGAVSKGLDAICDAIDEISDPSKTTVIVCSGTIAIVSFWLKSYLDAFAATHPDLRFVLFASDEDDTLRNFDEVDFSLICGNERCEVGENLYYLFSELIEPVCSPAYARLHGPFTDVMSVAKAELLDLHPMHWSSDAISRYPFNWQDWFGAKNFEGPIRQPTIVSNSYTILVESAVGGQGIILGWHHLVRSHLEQGKLVALLDSPLRVDRRNYLKVNKASFDKPYVQELLDFILKDVASVDVGHLPPT
jgi:DNA-binding transcriptional LysR family regulator